MVVSLAQMVTLLRILAVLAIVAAFVALLWGLRKQLSTPRLGRAWLFGLACAPVILASAASPLATQPDLGKRQNAVLAFVAAAVLPPESMAATVAQLAGSVVAEDKAAFTGVSTTTLPKPPTPARPLENLVVVVLESTWLRAVAG